MNRLLKVTCYANQSKVIVTTKFASENLLFQEHIIGQDVVRSCQFQQFVQNNFPNKTMNTELQNHKYTTDNHSTDPNLQSPSDIATQILLKRLNLKHQHQHKPFQQTIAKSHKISQKITPTPHKVYSQQNNQQKQTNHSIVQKLHNSIKILSLKLAQYEPSFNLQKLDHLQLSQQPHKNKQSLRKSHQIQTQKKRPKSTCLDQQLHQNTPKTSQSHTKERKQEFLQDFDMIEGDLNCQRSQNLLIEYERLKKQNNIFRNSQNNMKVQLSKVKENWTQCSNKIIRLQKQLEQKQTKIFQLNKVIKSKEEFVKTINLQFSQKISDLQTVIGDYKLQVDDIRALLAAANLQIISLKQKISDQNFQIQNFKCMQLKSGQEIHHLTGLYIRLKERYQPKDQSQTIQEIHHAVFGSKIQQNRYFRTLKQSENQVYKRENQDIKGFRTQQFLLKTMINKRENQILKMQSKLAKISKLDSEEIRKQIDRLLRQKQELRKELVKISELIQGV